MASRRTFSSTTGTAVSGIHSQAGFHQLILDMFSDRPRSCRRLGGALGFDRMTIWRWRQKIIRVLGGSGASELGGLVEADEKFFWESRKGSREWVRHQRDPIHHPKPDRMRWVDYKRTRTPMPAGISKYQIPVLTIADRAGARRADVLPDHSAPPLMAVLARCLRSDAVLCSDRDPAYDFFARQNGMPHYPNRCEEGPFRYRQGIPHPGDQQTARSLRTFHGTVSRPGHQEPDWLCLMVHRALCSNRTGARRKRMG